MTYTSGIEKNLNNIVFHGKFVKNLPGDPDTSNYRRQVHNACYSLVSLTPVSQPELVAVSPKVAGILGFSRSFYRSRTFVETFAGNRLMQGMQPYAMCYGGHQFGSWAGQLGDGRAINLGEINHPESGSWTLQLKGAGPTPYSRTVDGLAVLRSSIREFLCSEAMHHLGIPTTRALSLILTGEDVERDMFYDGHPKLEPGAVVCRVSPFFLRFGNFEIFSARNDIERLKILADYTIQNDFPHLNTTDNDIYIQWFNEVSALTATLITHWMRVGFVHGVMNTDNMSILGLTIDYGPYGWLEDYNPAWTPNTTDARTRRYCFGNQPKIAQWNLAQLANTIYPLVGEVKPLQDAVNNFWVEFEKQWQTMMIQKLGFDNFKKETDEPLVKDLLELMSLVETDYTLFFRQLALVDVEGYLNNEINIDQLTKPLSNVYYQPEELTSTFKTQLNSWFDRYTRRIQIDDTSPEKRQRTMNRVNPKYVLRNYLAQLSIEKAEEGDFSMIHELMDVMRHPYDEQPGKEAFAEKRPDWARTKPGCSMLSCSS